MSTANEAVLADERLQNLDLAPEFAERLGRSMQYAELIYTALGLSCTSTGTLLDVGAGGAWIDIGLALLTKLDFVVSDINPFRFDPADQNVEAAGLGGRMEVVEADVHELPFSDNSFDYVITQASFGFWHNPQRGVQECIRVLKPGHQMFLRGFEGNRYHCIWDILKDARVEYFSINRRCDASWVDIWKNTPEQGQPLPCPARTPCGSNASHRKTLAQTR